MSEKIKMYCIFAKESLAKMQNNVGKLAAQAGHAYLHAAWDASERFPQSVKDYRESNHVYKIACVVDSVQELQQLAEFYYDKVGISLVKDAGFTIFSEPTITCLGIGPIRDSQIESNLKSLALLSRF